MAVHSPSDNEAGRVGLTRWCLWLLVCIGLAVRVAYAFIDSPLDKIYLDARMEYDTAKAIPNPTLFEAFLASGYPIWLKLELALTNEHRVPVGVITALMSVCTPWIWYRWMREHFRIMQLKDDKLLALIGFAILTWLPSWISIYSLFMPECLLLPLVGAGLWLCSYSLRTRRSGGYIGAALAWSAAYLTKASMLSLALIEGVWLAKDLFTAVRGARAIALTAGCVSIFIAAYLFETTRVYSTIHAFNLFAGNTVLNSLHYRSGGTLLRGTITVTADGGTVRREEFVLGCPSVQTASAPFAPLCNWRTKRHGEFTVDVDYTKPAGQQYPKLALSLPQQVDCIFENAVFLIFGQSWPDCSNDDLFHQIQIQTRWMFAALLLLAIVLAIKQRRKDVLTILSLAPWILFIGQQVYITEGRFRKPLEGLLIVECMVLAYNEVTERKRRQSLLPSQSAPSTEPS